MRIGLVALGLTAGLFAQAHAQEAVHDQVVGRENSRACFRELLHLDNEGSVLAPKFPTMARFETHRRAVASVCINRRMIMLIPRQLYERDNYDPVT